MNNRVTINLFIAIIFFIFLNIFVIDTTSWHFRIFITEFFLILLIVLMLLCVIFIIYIIEEKETIESKQAEYAYRAEELKKIN